MTSGMAKRLRLLIKGIADAKIRGNREVEIRGLSSDSRKVAPGDLFIARKGEKHDASQYIDQAIQAGAAAIATEIYDPFIKLPQLISANPGKIEAKIAAHFYGDPSKEMALVGVTGTKGKTTTSYLIQHLLGADCGLVSTVETVIKEERFPSQFTTHEPIYNQKILREMKAKGCSSVAFEVSSHGLALGRVDEIDFRVAVFTNLYPDHLDFHGTIEEYAKAKARLFCLAREKAIFNQDCPWTPFMKESARAPSFTYGIQASADLKATDLRFSSDGTTFRLDGKALVQTPLIGRHNVYNLLAAASVGIHFGMPLEEIARRLSSFDHVPGRLERVANHKGIQVFVDFAHNGDALANVLQSLKEIAPKRLLVLFGCGGNRDATRRKNMAMAAEQYADLAIITSDNPRSEPPEEIIREILSGFQNLEKAVVEPDRKRAIRLAIEKASPGDIVLIAGKGHEKVQIVGNQTYPFDDVAVAKEVCF